MKRIFVFLIIMTIAFSGCAKKKERARETPPVPVSVVKVKRGYIAEAAQFVGTIKANDEAEVFPRASGKVKEKLKLEGDFVKKDEPIMSIDRDEVGYEYAPSPVVAPIDGYIGRIFVDRGDSVTAQAAVANIVGIDKVKIRTDAPDRFISYMKIGQHASVSVDAYPDEEFKGEISMLSPQVEEATRTFPIEVVLANEEKLLKPGIFARVEVALREVDDAIIIPREAVIRVLGKTLVYVRDGNTARKREVELGIQKLDVVQVLSGLALGDEIIIRGQHRLKDASAIEVAEGEGE